MKLKLILGLVASFSFAAAQAQITPIPAMVTRAEGEPNTFHELSCKVGRFSFERYTANLPEAFREEAYLLTVTPDGYKIEANTETGKARALQTLRQMDFCGEIFDYPRFAYRGVMLDISRHFRDKDFIIKQMEAMASVKLNVLHLHLTDDAGWRIQIDRYPLLTRRAAWRKGASWKEWQEGGQQYAWMDEEGASGGFLTKDDVREIVAAGERLHIMVIPEIEMPAHSREVVDAYPSLGCREGSEELCPGRETTYDFLENVLSEIIELFPAPYIHVGGDEASRRDWEDCAYCQARMRREGITRISGLQSYLMRRVEDFLHAHGRRLIGWDEMVDYGLTPDATVMSWRGIEGGIEAMKQGHDVIMAPSQWCYINNAQDNPLTEPMGEGGYLSLERIYRYEPFDDVPPEVLKHLLGIQACLWQEHVVTEEATEYMLYPRIMAIAETGWSRAETKNYADFRQRAIRWTDALSIGTLTGKTFHPFNLRREFGERPARRADIDHLAKGCPVQYNMPWSPYYPAYGKTSLTDGRLGGWAYGDGRWQGFYSDVDVVVDLGEVQPIHFVGATFLCQPGPWIFLPSDVTVSVSDDNVHFRQVAVIPQEMLEPVNSYILMGAPVHCEGRYVHFLATRTKEWIFMDELIVN